MFGGREQAPGITRSSCVFAQRTLLVSLILLYRSPSPAMSEVEEIIDTATI